MAKRTVDTELWNNEDIIENFTAEDRYFWLYLLTNPHNNICGVVKNSPALMGRDMGYDKDAIINLIYRFEKVHGLIFTDKITNEIVILNWGKYNWTKSADLMKTVKKQLQSVQSEQIKAILNEKISEKLGDGLGTVLPPSGDGTITDTNTISNNNYINNNSLVSDKEITERVEDFDLLDYNELLAIVKEECPIIFNRHQAKVDNGKLQIVREVTQILEQLQGQYSYSQLREIFRKASKTFCVKPSYSSCDIKWVLNNISRVLAEEESDTESGEQTKTTKGVWDEMLENIGRIDKKGN